MIYGRNLQPWDAEMMLWLWSTDEAENERGQLQLQGLCSGGILVLLHPLGSLLPGAELVQGLSKGDSAPWAALPPSLNGR